MLKSLYISSFVIIDEVQIDFYPGMSALTGETGAGKSIIIDAIGQLLGNRTQSQFVKKGANKAVIEGIFEINNEDIVHVGNELNINIEDELVVTKEIYNNGKSNIKINYRNASLSALRMIMPYLIDIHSQFETQSLFSIKNHIHILDQYVSEDINAIKEEYRIDFKKYKNLKKQREQAIQEDLSDEQIEYLQSQVNEIEECEYTDEQVDELEAELHRLENYEKMNEVIQSFESLMTNNVLSSLKDAIYELSSIKDDDFNEYHDSLYNQYYDLKDTYDSIIDLYHSFSFDEYRFNELQETMFKINRLKRKYGYTMNDILEKKEEILSKIEMINHRDEYIAKIEKQIIEIENKCQKKAKTIHDLREKYALEFENEISKQLKDLYLPHALFHVNIKKVDMNDNGIDQVTLMISTNKGQDMSILSETASGGEISRVMLAIKTIILRKSKIDTIIFDEVDTGVSGKVAASIGEKMKELGEYKQVICITHLPQVATRATYHYSIEKKTDEKDTVSSIHLLDRSGRIEELAKMLSGDKISDEARKNAEILLNE
jgi:DNA repair protein RecN (Recombination protein N)